jgi:hypothetical protein
LARYFIFYHAKELPSPSVRRGGQEDLLFFSLRRSSYLPEALRLGAFASISSFLKIMACFITQRRRDAKELPSPSVRRGGEEDLFFFSRRSEGDE